MPTLLRRRSAPPLLAALLLGAVLAACGGETPTPDVAAVSTGGGGGASGASTTKAPSKQDVREAQLAFARCMREHGVDMADPTADGGMMLQVKGPQEARKAEKAQKACEPLIANAMPKPSAAEVQKQKETMLAFAKCMREHGIDMPDPVFDDQGRVQQRMTGKIDQAKLAKASAVCAKKAGTDGPMFGGPPPSGGGAGVGVAAEAP